MTALTQKRLVVIPMKDPSRAKTRLGAALDANGRAGIALALFRATLNHLSETLMLLPHGSADIAVLTSSPEISRIARRAGVALIDDEGHDGLSQSLEVAAAWGARQGYDAICILPGDLAAPKACDLARLLNHDLAQGRAVFCPSADLGTNALLAPLPCPFRFQYGPNSVVHHRRAAERAGLWPVILPLESLRIDVDTVEDLGHLLARNPQILAQEATR